MPLCGCCGQETEPHGKCQVRGCTNGAQYEGWYENKDFSGNKVGSMRLTRVCEEHRSVLIGGK